MSLNKFITFDESKKIKMNIEASSLKTDVFAFKPPNVTPLTGKVLQIQDEDGNVTAIEQGSSDTPSKYTTTYRQGGGQVIFVSVGVGYVSFIPSQYIDFTGFTPSSVIRVELHGTYQTYPQFPSPINVPIILPVRFALESQDETQKWTYTYEASNAGDGMLLPASIPSNATNRAGFTMTLYIAFSGWGTTWDIYTSGTMSFYGNKNTTEPSQFTAISNLRRVAQSGALQQLPSTGANFYLETENSHTEQVVFYNDTINMSVLLNSI